MSSGEGDGPFRKIGAFFDSYGGLIASTLGSVVLAFSGGLLPQLTDLLQYGRWQTLLVYAGTVLAVVGALSVGRAATRVSKLTAENKQLQILVKSLGDDIEEKWRHVLIQIFEQCKLNNNSRISIYRHEGSNFIMLARFSLDPDKRRTGRGFYPLDQGCIGQAYRNRESVAQIVSQPGTPQYFAEVQRDWNIAANVALQFKMKARSIVALAIEEKGTYERPLVIVYESTEANAFALRKLKTVTESFNETLCGLYRTLEPLLPSLSYARQEGF